MECRQERPCQQRPSPYSEMAAVFPSTGSKSFFGFLGTCGFLQDYIQQRCRSWTEAWSTTCCGHKGLIVGRCPVGRCPVGTRLLSSLYVSIFDCRKVSTKVSSMVLSKASSPNMSRRCGGSPKKIFKLHSLLTVRTYSLVLTFEQARFI